MWIGDVILAVGRLLLKSNGLLGAAVVQASKQLVEAVSVEGTSLTALSVGYAAVPEWPDVFFVKKMREGFTQDFLQE